MAEFLTVIEVAIGRLTQHMLHKTAVEDVLGDVQAARYRHVPRTLAHALDMLLQRLEVTAAPADQLAHVIAAKVIGFLPQQCSRATMPV